MLPVVDAHLDLAVNAAEGFDLTTSAHERRVTEGRGVVLATVGLPDLIDGGVAVVFATIFATPRGRTLGAAVKSSLELELEPRGPKYSTPEEAAAIGVWQLDVYRRWEDEGRIRILTSVAGLEAHLEAWAGDRRPGLVVLMEGADPIVDPGAVADWWARGLRIVGPAWARTRYAHGTDAPGGLTGLGRELLAAMEEVGMALDVSHLAEQACREALAFRGPICATHVHPRALSDTDRHLPDDVLRALADHGAVIGLTMVNEFLTGDMGLPSSLADDWRRHAEYLAAVVGWDHVGIGSDLDGGIGRDESPAEIDTVADLRRAAEAVPAEHREAVLAGNWLRWLRAALPAEDPV
jgi:membrane dipeptidase